MNDADVAGVNENILRAAKEQAEMRDKFAMPPSIDGIDEPGYAQTEYFLIQEYLQSIGLSTSPEVLRFESQHPTLEKDRKSLSNELQLRYYEKTPLLVQLIAERLQQIEKMDRKGRK